MKSCWLKLLVLLPLAWWLASCGMSEFSPSHLLGLPHADADDQPAADAGGIDFEKQIKPIFAKHCVDCHKADKDESGFRLDVGHLAIKGGDRGAAIIPGKSDESILYQALIGKGDATAMPYEKPRLPAADIELIKKWIDRGAKVPASDATTEVVKSNHWSFQPIRRPALPKLQNSPLAPRPSLTPSTHSFDRVSNANNSHRPQKRIDLHSSGGSIWICSACCLPPMRCATS